MKHHKLDRSILIAHAIGAALVLLICIPDASGLRKGPLLCAVGLAECVFLLGQRNRKGRRGAGDVLAILYGVLLLWELFTTKLHWMHPILYPSPEKVFCILADQPKVLLSGVVSSLGLLAFGLILGTAAGVLAGLFAGVNERLGNVVYPIA